jgi:hypothetical protein
MCVAYWLAVGHGDGTGLLGGTWKKIGRKRCFIPESAPEGLKT